MMNRRQDGFTVIEMTIVLAIAGVILALVLLAIPNLQRNGRNNQRDQDVQTILEVVSRYELNHSGTIPDTAQLKSFLNSYEKDQLTYYSPDNVTVNTPDPSNTVGDYPAVTDLDAVVVNNHAKCVSVDTANNQGAGYSDVVALYAIETSGGSAPHCKQL